MSHLAYFLHLLISHLMSVGVCFSAAAPMIDIGTQTGNEGESDTSGEETPAASTEGEETPENTEGTEGEETAEETAEEGKGGAKADLTIDWKKIPAEVKSHIQELGKTNPKLSNMLQNAVYTSQTFLKEVPGGLKEIQALKQSIEEVGGIEEIKTLRATHQNLVDEQENLDGMARNGDVRILDNLVEIAGGDGFSKLMPAALDKWSASDPDGYSHVLSKVMVSAMQEGNVIADLNLAFKMLGLKNEAATEVAIESLKKVAAWANNVGAIASKTPEKAKVDPQIEEQQRSIDTQKTAIFNKEFGNSFAPWRENRILEEVKSFAPNNKLNEYQLKTLGAKVVEEIKGILSSDSDYMKSLERIYSTRNMPDLLKFTKSRTDKLLSTVVRKAYKNLFSDPTRKAPAKKAANSTAATTTTAAAQPVKGWTKISEDKAPAPGDIDGTKTDFKMKFNKQAILKDGRKVYWGTKVPA